MICLLGSLSAVVDFLADMVTIAMPISTNAMTTARDFAPPGLRSTVLLWRRGLFGALAPSSAISAFVRSRSGSAPFFTSTTAVCWNPFDVALVPYIELSRNEMLQRSPTRATLMSAVEHTVMGRQRLGEVERAVDLALVINQPDQPRAARTEYYVRRLRVQDQAGALGFGVAADDKDLLPEAGKRCEDALGCGLIDAALAIAFDLTQTCHLLFLLRSIRQLRHECRSAALAACNEGFKTRANLADFSYKRLL